MNKSNILSLLIGYLMYKQYSFHLSLYMTYNEHYKENINYLN